MTFTYIPNVPTTTQGTVYMAVTDDPDESSPISGATIVNMRTAIATSAYAKATLSYRPSNSNWLFTRDQVTSDDRLEMPGVFLLGTESFGSTSVSPGRVLVDYDIEMKDISNSTVNA